MKKTILASLFFCCNSTAEITLKNPSLTLATPNAPCKLSMPDKGWQLVSSQKRPNGTATYYYYTLDSEAINFSVYIDRSNECNNNQDCLDLALKNPSYSKAKSVIKYDFLGFRVAEIVINLKDLVNVEGAQLNLVAEKYDNGCWFDVHLSKVGTEAPSSNDLLKILEGIKTN